MASDLEEQKKVLLPILQRATEIEAMEPRVAYYCRLYALKRALELPNPAEPIQGLVKALFDQCEKDKPKVSPNEAADREYVKNFALTVFGRADKLDRARRADINTAKCYYAAAIFLQVLEQFLGKGEELELVEPEAVEKARYALWRAAELRKAVREGRAPVPPPEPADMAAAVAGAAAAEGGGAYGSSGGGAGGGDMFAGPSYEAGGGYNDVQQPPPAAPPVHAGDTPAQSGGGGGGPVSSTEEFLNLPRPPSTVPPEGSVGLVEPAAAAGPRYRPGSAVWVAPAAAGQVPVRGTVGQLVSADGGAGGQALYKVALPHEIQELPDSALAPDVGPNTCVSFVSAIGEHPQPASIIAMQTDAWPCRYLLQLDSGGNLAAAGGQIRLDAPDAPPPHSTAAGPHVGAGPYPSLHGLGPGSSLPGAPPLVGPAPGQQQQQPRPQPPPAAPQPGTSPYGSSGGGGYPSQLGGGSSSGAGAAPPVARQPLAAAAAAAPPAGGSWSPGAAAALDAAVQAAAQGACKPSATAISEAQKYAKFAVSSLNHDDVSGAVKFLSDALKALIK